MNTKRLRYRLSSSCTTSLTLPLLAAISLGLSGARAGCNIDFEDLPIGTTVTNQYSGVAFSIGNLGGEPTYMRIQTPEYGTTSSGTQCLKITPGSGGLSPEYLVMVFDLPQTHIS